MVHDAGCTCDDTELPHHVTTRPDIERLVAAVFRPLLGRLPGKPTIVTISRSSEDDYCPPEDVDFIQEAVLKELRLKFSPVKLQLAYLEEGDQ
ncbi:UPF0489 protein C5orf22 homolog [Schistocerca piceifrons]|uniref:UPF0489 protein C5orf22 homolog n=1 Tax=Schistocerca piceifrons TaxID=274613 RepID=UPI001F5E7D82|nr:UPF0489 protein C5orf22 homolog [Schistocerca piceifrons]XP_049778208.1 UPF0489 protein C5orf22 homolog [Schistocerca cancellata]XP_049808004.1 UPF0489 protein C5orf22 homolog [Schistocerca nitens]